MDWSILLCLIAVCQEISVNALLFPANSVIQLTCLYSAPVELPGRKIFWDWGIQMNYDLPYNLERFTSIPIWPGKFDRKRRDLDISAQYGNHSLWHVDDKYQDDAQIPGKHPSDFTAAELYHALENLLASYGLHETCLLRSVCEMARHPFSDDRQNLITEVLTFILTPSIHEAFSGSESVYRDAYEEAERLGFLHYNCEELYNECELDLLTAISNIIVN